MFWLKIEENRDRSHFHSALYKQINSDKIDLLVTFRDYIRDDIKNFVE